MSQLSEVTRYVHVSLYILSVFTHVCIRLGKFCTTSTTLQGFPIGLPPFHCPNPGWGSKGKADGGPGVSPRENFWNCIRDLIHFDAVWWQLFVSRRTRYICNFAIKIKPICQLQCPRDCLQCFDAVGWAAGRASGL